MGKPKRVTAQRATARTHEHSADSSQGAPLLHTVTATSRRLGLCRTTTTALLDRGELGYVRVLGGDRRVPDAEIIRYIERNLVRTARPEDGRDNTLLSNALDDLARSGRPE